MKMPSPAAQRANVLAAFCFSCQLCVFPAQAVSTVNIGSVSGELLQNNPMLRNDVTPSSKPLEKLDGQHAESIEAEDAGVPAILIKTIHVTHVPPSSQQAVEALIKPFAGKRMTFIALKNLAVRITAMLQEKGERLSYAYIPDQQVTDNTVTLDVLNGHIEAVKLGDNQSLLAHQFVNNYLSKMATRKTQITELEQFMSRIADLPGVGNVSSYLSPGEEPGGSLLTLNLLAGPRVDGVMVFDNMGSVSSGRNRLGMQLNVNSPLGMGDKLQLLAYVAPDFLQINHKSDHGNTLIGRLAYDLPIGYRGSRWGLAVSRVNYKLGGPTLSGLGNGYADIASLYASYPLLRSDNSHLNLGANLDWKRMHDRFWGMNNDRHTPVLGLQLSGDKQGALGRRPWMLQYQLAASAGRISNADEWNGASTRGHFLKLMQNLNYLQSLTPGVNLTLNFTGQQANKNLDGAEKMSLGGAYAVRAYGNSAASVDSGYVISPGISIPVPWLDKARFELFYDYGRGKMQKFAPQSQKVVLKGYGIGLAYNFTQSAFINASYAWRQGNEPLLGPQNKATGWITAGLQF